MPLEVLVVDDLRSFGEERSLIDTDNFRLAIGLHNSVHYYARTALKALQLLRLHRKQGWDEIYLDHDLGPQGDVDLVVKYLVAHKYRVHHIFIHSMNIPARQRIAGTLSPYYPVTEIRPLDAGLISVEIKD